MHSIPHIGSLWRVKPDVRAWPQFRGHGVFFRIGKVGEADPDADPRTPESAAPEVIAFNDRSAWLGPLEEFPVFFEPCEEQKAA